MLIKLRLLFLFCITLLCFSSLCLATEQQFKVSKKSSLFGVDLKGVIDVRKDRGELYKKHADLGARVDVPIDGLMLGVNYRRIYTLAKSGWLLENRPYIQLEQKIKSRNKVDWRFRLRQEFRYREGKVNSQRSRFRAKVKLPYQVFKAKPFISNEYFYDLTAHQLSQTRIEMGLTFKRFKGVTPTLALKVTAKQKTKWQTSSAIVLGIAF